LPFCASFRRCLLIPEPLVVSYSSLASGVKLLSSYWAKKIRRNSLLRLFASSSVGCPWAPCWVPLSQLLGSADRRRGIGRIRRRRRSFSVRLRRRRVRCIAGRHLAARLSLPALDDWDRRDTCRAQHTRPALYTV